MSREEKEKLLRLLDEIKHKTVIVEGPRDRAVLRSLGFTNIVVCQRGLWETAERIRAKEVVILTDFDVEGAEIAAKLGLFLQGLSIKVNRAKRRELKFAFVRNNITAIEELSSIKRGDVHGKTGAKHHKIHYLRAFRGRRHHREA
jgi:5S rRNA maturation endonuclease (ribonuclease M5)